MSPFAPFTEAQFQYLAMGKACAYSWETLAQQIEMPLEIVERVAWTHEKQWNRFLTKAERHIARETIAEVAGILRQDIRNTEPQLHATLTNSLSRVLKLQQEYAPPHRPRPINTISPTPTPEVVAAPTMPAPVASPTVGPLGATVASLLGFFVLLGALLLGCWNRARGHEHPETVTHEPTACMVATGPCSPPICTSDFSLTRLHVPASGSVSSG